MNYKEQYKHPKWQKKRLEVLERDEFKCRICGSTEKTLHIHHKYYTLNKEVWDYINDALITYCNDCHSDVEESKKSLDLNVLRNLYNIGLSEVDITNLTIYLAKHEIIAKYISKKGDLITDLYNKMIEDNNPHHAK